MNKYINDKSPFAQSTDEIENHVVLFEGHDRPRYVFPNNSEAGYLGLDDWYNYWQKPVFVEEGTGTLDADKYYSIIVVPVKTDIDAGGLAATGEATQPSIPIKPITPILDSGTATSGSDGSVTDSTKAWTVNEFAGQLIRKTSSGTTAIITSNTATTINFPTGLTFTASDAYEVVAYTDAVKDVKSLVFSVPTHDQYKIDVVGTATNGGSGYVENDAATWQDDEFVGRLLKSVDTGEVSYIWQNTDMQIFASGLAFTAGNRYQILRKTATRRHVYAAELDDEDSVSIASYYFQGEIPNNTDTTYELKSFVVSSNVYDSASGFLPPPNANCAKQAGGILFCGGGISETRGKAQYVGTEQEIQATSTTDEHIAVTVVDDEYTDAGSARIARITLGDDLDGFDDVCVGSYVTVSGSEDTENDIEDARVLRVNDTEVYATEPSALENVPVGTFNGTDDYIYISGLGGFYAPQGCKITVTANLQKSSVRQTILSKYAPAIVYGWGDLYIDTNNDIVFASLASGGVTGTAKVLSANWTAGWQTLEVDASTKGATVVFKSNGSALTSSGESATGTWGHEQHLAEFAIGAKVYDNESSKNYYFGGEMLYIKFEDSADSSKNFSYSFSEDTGLSLNDGINNNDGTIRTSDQAAFWYNTAWANNNSGNGEATVDITGGAITESWKLTCTDAAATFTASDPVVTGTGDGDVSGPVAGTTDVAENWTITCTANGPTATFSVVGSVSGSQATLTSETPYTCTYFSIDVSDGTAAWAIGDTITFSVTLPVIGAVFSVVGTESGAQADLTSGVAYSNDYFDAEITDGTAGWEEGDFFVFQVGEQAVDDVRWIEINNNEAVANADDETMKLVVTPNYIQGNTTGTDQTYFSEGMVDAQFSFNEDVHAPYVVSWVDYADQKIGIASKYAGVNDSDKEFKIVSDYALYYSDVRNPHRFRYENIINIGDSITGLGTIGDSLVVFCKNSLWRVGLDALYEQPVLVSDNIRCPAQYSITKGEKYLMFYDGTGFSITDGVSVQSVTAYKAQDYLDNINKAYEKTIVGTYDRENSRFEFAMPMGTGTKNDYGIYITEGSWSCYPFSRPDCNAMWTNYNDGNLKVYHGTSGDLEGGDGTIWEHTGENDGTSNTGAYLMEITAITDNVISVSSDGDTDIETGDVITIYPNESGTGYRQAIVESISKTSTDPAPVTYDITVADSYALTGFTAGDTVCYGLIPFDFGIKWTDFGSPQYKHQVREIHLDLQDAYGLIYVDQFLDMSTVPVSTVGYSVFPDTTKLVVPFRGGKGYKYGFRVRALTIKTLKINSFEILFDTQV